MPGSPHGSRCKESLRFPPGSGCTCSTAACSTSTAEGVERYHVTPAEVGETRMPVPCFLVAHPRGTLMWDLGVIPDSIVRHSRQGARANVNPTAAAVVTRTLKSQLAQIGYTPADITYVAISHAHIDHTRQPERVRRLDVADDARRARLHVGREQHARQPVVLHRAQEQPIGDRPRQGRVRRVRRRPGRHQGRARAYARPSGADPEAGVHRTRDAERRPLSLSRRSGRFIARRRTTSSTSRSPRRRG